MGNSPIHREPVINLLNKKYFIPSYQRGYRWTERNIHDLLEDIDRFVAEGDSWYCLQPIVVKKMSRKEIENKNLTENLDEEWFEVVDGQQRLTTIMLIIHYANERWNGYEKDPEPTIKYETRSESSEFFKNLQVESDNSVKIDNTYIDYFFFSSAYNDIHQWVQEKGTAFNRKEFLPKFEFKTEAIWYEIGDETSPIDSFIRINMGKIPLTNSELIKALFLQKRLINSESENFRQIEIATEWDRIESELQNDDFWWFLNRTSNEKSARIEFLFDVICEIELSKNPSLLKIIGTDNYSTFRYFNSCFGINSTMDEVKKHWAIIKDFFLAFNDWFNDTIWYHYIGYLIFSGKSISDIYLLYKEQSKINFTLELKKQIKNELFKDVKCLISSLEDSDNKDQPTLILAQTYLEGIININKATSQSKYDIDLTYGKNTSKIREILLLYNLEIINNQYLETKKSSGEELNLKFPFKLFKKQKWDVEHIDSSNTKNLDSKDLQVEWIYHSMIDLGDKIDNELIQNIELFINGHSKAKPFEDLKKEIIILADEFSNDEMLKKGIGNLTLLSSSINRSYGNALFPSKRRIIIEKDNEGQFIPVGTKNVFLKHFDKNGNTKSIMWTENDIINYQNNIGETLNYYFT
jgi:uncharacterized protein with ParB-like and HNH nuclease domain